MSGDHSRVQLSYEQLNNLLCALSRAVVVTKLACDIVYCEDEEQEYLEVEFIVSRRIDCPVQKHFRV